MRCVAVGAFSLVVTLALANRSLRAVANVSQGKIEINKRVWGIVLTKRFEGFIARRDIGLILEYYSAFLMLRRC